MNRREVYDCNNANHVVIIKNLLEYSPVYAQSTATNQFNYLDKNSTPKNDLLKGDLT